MDLDDVMQELGLDMFTSSSNRTDDDDESFDDVEEPPEGFDDEMDVEAVEPEPEPGIEGEPGFESESDEDDGDDEVIERLEDISHEIDQLSSQVEDNQSSIKAMRDERGELMDRLDEIEENNATLLGVYDRLTNDINPFAADWDERYDRKVSEQDEQTFGVIEPPENEAEARAAAAGIDPEQENDEGDDGLTFSDLKDKHESDGDEEDEEDENTDEGERGDEPVPEDVTPSDPTETPDPQAVEVNGNVTPTTLPEGSGDAYLETLAPTFASEVVMMEWLSMLIEIAGPAGAMKALDFYERIDWISPAIKRQMEDVLSGAHTDDLSETPARPPSDLTAEEHNRSFAHIMRLAQQSRLARAREG